MINTGELDEKTIEDAVAAKKKKDAAAEAKRIANNPLRIAWQDASHEEQPLMTLANFEALLAHFQVRVRYNEMAKNLDIEIPGLQTHNDLHLTMAFAKLRDLAAQARFNAKAELIMDYVWLVGGRNSYHPVREAVMNTEWDGVNRLNMFYDSVILKDHNEIKETILFKWAHSCIGAVFEPNFSNEGVLIFQGAQGIGKTTWLSWLVNGRENGAWIKLGSHLDLSNKDSRIENVRNWIVELGELGTTFGSSKIDQLKAYLTQNKDTIRRPYGKAADDFQRQTVYFATVNEKEFLRDIENRRFWVLNVEGFDCKKHTQWDALQFWRQMYEIYVVCRAKRLELGSSAERYDYSWYMNRRELAIMAQRQEHNRDKDVVEEKLEHRLVAAELCQDTEENWLNATAVLERLSLQITNSNKRKVIAFLDAWGYQIRTGGNKKLYCVEFNNDTVATDQDTRVVNLSLDQFKRKTKW